MRPLLCISLLLGGSLTNCIGWDEYYGGDRQRYESGAGNEKGAEMIAIPAGMKGSYYLVDRKRNLCFFQNGDALAAVDCESIPEAAELLGKSHNEYQPTERVPNPIRQREPRTERGQNVSTTQVTPDETAAFTSAYTEIICKSRQGSSFSPHEIIAKHGLTAARYTTIEGSIARDKRKWSKLTREARATCQSSQPQEASPNLQPAPATPERSQLEE